MHICPGIIFESKRKRLSEWFLNGISKLCRSLVCSVYACLYVSMSQDVCISAMPLVFGTNSVMANSSKTEVELQSRDLRRFPALHSVKILLVLHRELVLLTPPRLCLQRPRCTFVVGPQLG